MSRATTRQSLKSLLTLSNLAQNQVPQTPLSLSPSSAISTTTMASFQSLKLALFLLLAISDFHAPPFAVNALNIGIQSSDSSIQVSKECSRKCESEFCSVPPFLRYGKYCGLLYSGCPGEKPCDGLDACCMLHDACIQAKNNDYLSQECSQNFVNCMAGFRMAGEHTFKGNKCQVDEVIDVINLVMDAALLAGRVLHKP
ncbi:Phospholipase A2-alpha [Ancistrocladus abbreviatus]